MKRCRPLRSADKFYGWEEMQCNRGTNAEKWAKIETGAGACEALKYIDLEITNHASEIFGDFEAFYQLGWKSHRLLQRL